MPKRNVLRHNVLEQLGRIDARLRKAWPDFQIIPVEQIGLRRDSDQVNAPVHPGTARESL